MMRTLTADAMKAWSNYKLTGLVRSTETFRVYRAEDQSDRRRVLVHVLSQNLDAGRRLATITRVVQASISPQGALHGAILDFGEWQGVHGFVTDDRQDLVNALAAFTDAPNVGVSVSKEEVAETTRVFTAMRDRETTAAEPGEFTRLFRVPPVEPAKPSPTAATSQTASATPAVSGEPGEFTRMFQAPAAPVNVPLQRASAPPPPAAATPLDDDLPTQQMPAFRPEQQAPQPGEFTRSFQTPAATTPPAQTRGPAPPAAAHPPDAPSRTSSAPSEPGEFTALFQSPPATAPSSASQSAPSEPFAGEFAQLFRRPEGGVGSPGPTAPASPAAAPPLPQTPAAPAESSEFTAMFQTPAAAGPAVESTGDFTKQFQNPGAPAAAPAVPQTSAAPVESSEFTAMFQTPAAIGPQVGKTGGDFTKQFQSAGGPPAAPQAPAASAQGPGEFTQMFHSPASASRTSPSPQQQPPAPPPPTSGPPGDFTRLFQSPPPSAKPAQDQNAALEFERFQRAPVFDTPPPSRTENLPGQSAPDWFLNPNQQQPMPAPPKREMSDFTRVFGTSSPGSPTPTPAGGAPSHATGIFNVGGRSTPSAGPEAAPSEFTRMIQTPVHSAQQQQPAQAAPSPSASAPAAAAQTSEPAPKRNMLPIILIVIGVLAVALIITVILVAKKPAVTVPTTMPAKPAAPATPSLPR